MPWRIKWLDSDRTEAEIIKGYWFWKRIAVVKQHIENIGGTCFENWYYQPDNVEVDLKMKNFIRYKRIWRKPARLPKAVINQ